MADQEQQDPFTEAEAMERARREKEAARWGGEARSAWATYQAAERALYDEFHAEDKGSPFTDDGDWDTLEITVAATFAPSWYAHVLTLVADANRCLGEFLSARLQFDAAARRAQAPIHIDAIAVSGGEITNRTEPPSWMKPTETSWTPAMRERRKPD